MLSTGGAAEAYRWAVVTPPFKLKRLVRGLERRAQLLVPAFLVEHALLGWRRVRPNPTDRFPNASG